MESITFIPKNRTIKNAVIRKICKENNIDNSNYKIYCNKYYNYTEYDNDISITLLSTIYKGIEYTFEYFSGCFNAYMVATVIDFKYIVNQYYHYILKNNEGIDIFVQAGWEINNNTKVLFDNYSKTIKMLKSNDIINVSKTYSLDSGVKVTTFWNQTIDYSDTIPSVTYNQFRTAVKS